MSTHAPEHSDCPPAHAHLLAVQVWPAGQLVLHAPQLAVSLVKFAQLLPHAVSPEPHVSAHLPAEHTEPEAHTVPHVPQLLPSDCTSTQPELHSVRLAKH